MQTRTDRQTNRQTERQTDTACIYTISDEEHRNHFRPWSTFPRTHIPFKMVVTFKQFSILKPVLMIIQKKEIIFSRFFCSKQ